MGESVKMGKKYSAARQLPQRPRSQYGSDRVDVKQPFGETYVLHVELSKSWRTH